MADPEEKNNKSAEPTAADLEAAPEKAKAGTASPAGPSLPAAAEVKKDATATEAPANVPAAPGPRERSREDKEEEVRRLKMSDELEKALRDAEASVKEKGDGGAKDMSPVAEPGEAAFDPNRVETVSTAAPAPSSPKELELKMQIVELRQQLRAKDQEIEKKIKEMKQNADQAKHIQSQFDGYKSRVMKEKADWFNYGHEPILKELLLVVDNVERALAHAQEDPEVKSLAEGVELIRRQFLAVLAKFGVSGIEAEGKEFNPEFHQALVMVENAAAPPNTVLEVHQRGYLLKDRLLRPATVVVSKAAAAGPAPAAAKEKDQGRS